MDDSVKIADLVKSVKSRMIVDRLYKQIAEAKSRLSDILLGYQQMVVDNKEQIDSCVSVIANDIKAYKYLRKVYQRYMLACHTLLYVKDCMEGAVETYTDAAAFMKEVEKQSENEETANSLYRRLIELTQLKEKFEKEAHKEGEKHCQVLEKIIKRHENFCNEMSLLQIKRKELDSALRDIDCRISREEQFMYEAHTWNERGWRQYSLVSFTLFDILKYLVEKRNADPKIMKSTLWDKMEFIRREHAYNLEVLRRWHGEASNCDGTIDLGPERIEMNEEERNRLLLRKLKGICREYGGGASETFKSLFGTLKLRFEGTMKSGEELLKAVE